MAILYAVCFAIQALLKPIGYHWDTIEGPLGSFGFLYEPTKATKGVMTALMESIRRSLEVLPQGPSGPLLSTNEREKNHPNQLINLEISKLNHVSIVEWYPEGMVRKQDPH